MPADVVDANLVMASWPVRVYWEDTDAGGVVFYANYLKFFERARTEWLRSLGFGQQQLREQYHSLFVVKESTIKYVRSARLDDCLTVQTQILSMGRANIVLKQSAFLDETVATTEPLLLCESTTQIVWVHLETMLPQKMPDNLRQVLCV